MPVLSVPYADLPSLVGREVESPMTIEVTQSRINQFAEATSDFNYIHVDVEKAKVGPFGTTIAHGFLTLSLFAPMWFEVLDVPDAGTRINIGADKVRFTAPVPSGTTVRLNATIQSVTEIKGGYQLLSAATITAEGHDRPSVVIEFLERFLP